MTMPKWCTAFKYVCKASQFKRTAPKLNALCHRKPYYYETSSAVRAQHYQSVRYVVLSKSAAPPHKYVPTVYIWPEECACKYLYFHKINTIDNTPFCSRF